MLLKLGGGVGRNANAIMMKSTLCLYPMTFGSAATVPRREREVNKTPFPLDAH